MVQKQGTYIKYLERTVEFQNNWKANCGNFSIYRSWEDVQNYVIQAEINFKKFLNPTVNN
jgi:hypothetical protein